MTTIKELETIKYSGDIRVDSLQDDISPWNYLVPYRNILYYTFDVSAESYIQLESDTVVTKFNSTQINASRNILSYVGDLIGVKFTEVEFSYQADIHFGATDISTAPNVSGQNSMGYSYSSSNSVLTAVNVESIVFLDNYEFLAENNAPVAGNGGYETLLHEIGHAMGLGHPFDLPNKLSVTQDNTDNTVMSYNSTGSHKSVFQSYDLMALDWIYGGDGLAGDWGYNSFYGNSLSPAAADTVAPIIVSFSPLDAATQVAVNTNIVLTFSEAVQRGNGSIVLKTAAGVVIEIFDAASSNRIGLSGSTLTIDPSTNLSHGTKYLLDFSAGTFKDTAGNLFAGSSSYDFTTVVAAQNPVTPSKLDDFVVLQYASPAVLGAGAGNDTYLISGSLLPNGTSLTVSDVQGNNSIQLAPGLSITSSKVAANALQLTLNTGATVMVLSADRFTYDVGGNLTAGIDHADVGFATFAQSVLGVAVPAKGVVSGGSVVIGNGAAEVVSPLVVVGTASPEVPGSLLG